MNLEHVNFLNEFLKVKILILKVSNTDIIDDSEFI